MQYEGVVDLQTFSTRLVFLSAFSILSLSALLLDVSYPRYYETIFNCLPEKNVGLFRQWGRGGGGREGRNVSVFEVAPPPLLFTVGCPPSVVGRHVWKRRKGVRRSDSLLAEMISLRPLQTAALHSFLPLSSSLHSRKSSSVTQARASV